MNGFDDFDDVFGDTAAATEEATSELASRVDFESFEEEYTQNETSIQDNEIYKILTSDASREEITKQLEEYCNVSTAEERKNLLAQMSTVHEFFSTQTNSISKAVIAATNIDQASLLNATIEKIGEETNLFVEQNEVIVNAIQAFQRAEEEGKEITEIIDEAQANIARANEIAATLIDQEQEIDSRKEDVAADIKKRDKLKQQQVDADATVERLTKGCEEVKDPQTGEVTQEAVFPLAAYQQKLKELEGGWFKGKQKKEVQDVIDSYEAQIKEAKAESEALTPKIGNLNNEIAQDTAAIEKLEAEYASSLVEQEELRKEAEENEIIQAIADMVGDTKSSTAEEKTHELQELGDTLLNLISDEFSRCLDEYKEDQGNVRKLGNKTASVSDTLEILNTALTGARMQYDKDFKAKEIELDEAQAAYTQQQDDELAKAEGIENEDEKYDEISRIQDKYSVLPPSLQELKNEVEANGTFSTAFHRQTGSLTEFHQTIRDSHSQTRIVATNIDDLLNEADSKKNTLTVQVSSGVANSVNTLHTLLTEQNMKIVAAHTQKISKMNAVVHKTGVNSMGNRRTSQNRAKIDYIKQAKENVETMRAVAKTITEEARKGVALDAMVEKGLQAQEKAAQQLENSAKNSSDAARKAMNADSKLGAQWAKQANQDAQALEAKRAANKVEKEQKLKEKMAAAAARAQGSGDDQTDAPEATVTEEKKPEATKPATPKQP